jgi:hypothetical protein
LPTVTAEALRLVNNSFSIAANRRVIAALMREEPAAPANLKPDCHVANGSRHALQL